MKRRVNPSKNLMAAILILAAFVLMGLPAKGIAGPSKVPSPLAAGEKRPEGYQRVVDEMRAWDLKKADEVLSELRRKNPGLPVWDALKGAIAYLRGDYAGSIESLSGALQKNPGDSEWLELRLHVKQSQSALSGFRVFRTKHFDIWHDPKKDLILLPYLAKTMEAAYEVFGKILGVRPTRRVKMEIFSDPERFHKASTLTRRDIEKGVVGLTKFNKVMIISPGVLQRGYRWLDTAAHEYVHYLIVLATKNKSPIWLHEGIAKHMEKKWRGLKLPPLNPSELSLLARAQSEKLFIPFKSMEPSLIYLKTAEAVQLAYAESASAVDFIRRRVGKDALPKMFKAIRETPAAKSLSVGTRSPDSGGARPPMSRPSLIELEATGPPQTATPALEELLKVNLEKFEKIWRDDLKRQNLRIHPGATVRKYKLKPTGPVVDSGADLALLKSAVARRRTRLADRLWLRGRMKAALVEYKRALRDEPYSPALLNRLARVELRLRLLQRALRNLQKAVEVDPDYGATFIHRGIAYEMSGKMKSARKAWEEAIQINPFDPLPHERLAILYEKSGLSKDARREFELARKLRGS
ncbi:MAG: tetratricopeptide repeat protein [bacterium]